LDLLTDRFRFWEEIHPRQGKPGHQNRRVVSAIERVNITELAFIEEGSLFLRVFVPKNIFPKTEPVREQVQFGSWQRAGPDRLLLGKKIAFSPFFFPVVDPAARRGVHYREKERGRSVTGGYFQTS